MKAQALISHLLIKDMYTLGMLHKGCAILSITLIDSYNEPQSLKIVFSFLLD
jgi:hypothetical protein